MATYGYVDRSVADVLGEGARAAKWVGEDIVWRLPVAGTVLFLRDAVLAFSGHTVYAAWAEQLDEPGLRLSLAVGGARLLYSEDGAAFYETWVGGRREVWAFHEDDGTLRAWRILPAK